MAESIGIDLGRIVGMNSGRGVDEGMGIGEANGGFEIGWTVTRTDCQDVFQAGLASAFNNSSAIVVELGVIEVTVGIDEMHEAFGIALL